MWSPWGRVSTRNSFVEGPPPRVLLLETSLVGCLLVQDAPGPPRYCGLSARLGWSFSGSRRDPSRDSGMSRGAGPDTASHVHLLIKRARLAHGTQGLGERDDSWSSSRQVGKENVQEFWLGLLAPAGAELSGLSGDPRLVSTHGVRGQREQPMRRPGREQAWKCSTGHRGQRWFWLRGRDQPRKWLLTVQGMWYAHRKGGTQWEQEAPCGPSLRTW